MESPAEITIPISAGNPNKFTIKESTGKVIELTESKLIFEPLPLDDQTQRQPDMTLAHENQSGN